jgi:fatty-acyl-CoA synthase
VFVDELPHTATGKLSKRTLRERFRDYAWPAAARAPGG